MKVFDEKECFSAIDKNLYDFARSGAKFKEDDTFISYFGKSISYGKFTSGVDRLIKVLISYKELRKGDRIVISPLNMPEAMQLIYACNYVGLVPIMVDIRLSPREMKKIISDVGAKIAFVTDVNAAKLEIICEAECLQKLYVIPVAESIGFPFTFFKKFSSFFTGNDYMFKRLTHKKISVWHEFVNRKCDEIPADFVPAGPDSEIVFATSGSTGEKKDVRHRARSLNYNVYVHEYYYDMGSPEYESMLAFMPIFICFGFVGSLHLPMFFSQKIHVHMIYDIRKIPEIIMKVRPSCFVGSIGHWERIVGSEAVLNGDLSFLRYGLFSGEKCDKDRLEEINDILAKRGAKTKLWQAYGMTELALVSFQNPKDYKPGSVGKVLPLIEVCIVEPGTDKLVTEGGEGEICIHSICQTPGYLLNDEETKKLIHKHSDGKLWVHTGDFGYVDEEGFLFIKDRIKNMQVSVSGTKIYLPALESVVGKDEEIERCAAVSVKEENRNDIKGIILFVQCKGKTNENALKKNLRNTINEELPIYLHPDKIEILKEIPLTASGKTDYPALERIANVISVDREFSVVTLK